MIVWVFRLACSIRSWSRQRQPQLYLSFSCLFVIESEEKGPGPCTATHSGKCVILNVSQEAAPYPRAADGCNKGKTFRLLFGYLQSTALQNY